MDTDAMTDYYWENLKDILQRQLADDDEYRALIQKKIAAHPFASDVKAKPPMCGIFCRR